MVEKDISWCAELQDVLKEAGNSSQSLEQNIKWTELDLSCLGEVF